MLIAGLNAKLMHAPSAPSIVQTINLASVHAKFIMISPFVALNRRLGASTDAQLMLNAGTIGALLIAWILLVPGIMELINGRSSRLTRREVCALIGLWLISLEVIDAGSADYDMV